MMANGNCGCNGSIADLGNGSQCIEPTYDPSAYRLDY